jgi:hypothetical protein
MTSPKVGRRVIDIVRRRGTLPGYLDRSKPNSPVATIDPVEESLEARQRMLAMTVTESTVGELQDSLATRRAESEAKRAKAEADTEEATARLEEVRQKRSGGSNELVGMVMAMLDESQKGNLAIQEKLAATQATQFENVVNELRGQIAGVRQELVNQAAGLQDPKPDLSARIEEIMGVRDALASLYPKAPELGAVGNDIQTVILIKKLEMEAEDRRAVRTREEREFEVKHELRIAELRETQRRNDQFMEMIERVGAVATEIAKSRTGTAIPAEATVLSQQPMVQHQPQVTPTEPEVFDCKNPEGCSGKVTFTPGQTNAICSVCQTVYEMASV